MKKKVEKKSSVQRAHIGGEGRARDLARRKNLKEATKKLLAPLVAAPATSESLVEAASRTVRPGLQRKPGKKQKHPGDLLGALQDAVAADPVEKKSSARKIEQPKPTNPGVVVQAKDGKWHFGPPSCEALMRDEPKGVFKSAADATQANATEAYREVASSSPKAIEFLKKLRKVETGIGTGIMLDEHRNVYVPIDPELGLWLANVQDQKIDVVQILKDDPRRRKWISYEGGNSLADAAAIYEKSFLPKTAEAARAICKLQGKTVSQPPAEKPKREAPSAPKEKAGFTLATLCAELKIDPFEARKKLREKKAKKPGGRWEWPTREDAKEVIAILSAKE